MYDTNMGGAFDSLLKLTTSAGKAATGLATQVIQGKMAFDATKALWKGGTYVAPFATGERFTPATTQIAAPAERALTPGEIAEIQKTLNALGFNTGAVDGVFGPNTSAGIRAFQASFGQPLTGLLSMSLLQAVRVAATQAVNAPPQPAPITGNSSGPIIAAAGGAGSGIDVANMGGLLIPGIALLGVLAIVMSGRKR